ncbi:cation transport ATPase, partial [Calderihabitans maritimus]
HRRPAGHSSSNRFGVGAAGWGKAGDNRKGSG